MTNEEIMQALARGYSYPATEKEILNPDLISAMTDEILKLQSEKEQVAIEKETLLWLREQYLHYVSSTNIFGVTKNNHVVDKRLQYLSIAMNHITEKYENHAAFGIPDWNMSCFCDECKSAF